MGVRKMPQQVEAPWSKNYNTKIISSIVRILGNYLDNNITIIFYKFQAIVTSVTTKVILTSGKNLVLR